MRLNTEDTGNVVVITLGEPKLDATLSHEFKELATAAARSDRNIYLLDVSSVTFMDSSGIGAIVGVMKVLGRNNRLELCGLTPAVRKVFRLTRMDKIFKLHETREVALASHPAPVQATGT
ncbi:MAG: STAS domain-containing protein [Pseudomonadota bacterium]